MKAIIPSSLAKRLRTMGLWKAVEELRLRGVTLTISSEAPFDPKVIYCEPFNHDEKYQVQFFNEDDGEYLEASYGKTPKEAFLKAAEAAAKETA